VGYFLAGSSCRITVPASQVSYWSMLQPRITKGREPPVPGPSACGHHRTAANRCERLLRAEHAQQAVLLTIDASGEPKRVSATGGRRTWV
jgi:hypothetical protein